MQNGVAIVLPRAPRALVIKLPGLSGTLHETAITSLAGFLFVYNNKMCTLTPLAAQPDVVVNSVCGWVQRVEDHFCLCLPKIEVQTAKGRIVVTRELGPTVDDLLGAITTAPGTTAAQQAGHIASCFPGHAGAVASAIQVWRAGAAKTVPMARFLRQMGTQPVVPRRFQLVGGYLVSNRGVFQTAKTSPISIGGVTVGVCVRSDKQRVKVTDDGKIKTYAPVTKLHRADIGMVRNDIMVQEFSVRQQHRTAARPTPFPLPQRAVAPRDLLYRVRPEHVPAALAVFARYSDKNSATFGSYTGVRSNERAIVKELVKIELGLKTFATRARRVVLAAARGHNMEELLAVAKEKPQTKFSSAFGFKAGVAFRAPRTKRLLRNKSIWALDARVRASIVRKDGKTPFQEPNAMIGKPSSSWHNDADLKHWQTSGGQLKPFELIWEPKIDGWRILLHWDGSQLHWVSNTGRLLFNDNEFGKSWIPSDINNLVTGAAAGMLPFIIDCELSEGVYETVAVPELQSHSSDVTVTTRSRASAVRSRGADHTLFVIDCVVLGATDVSPLSLFDRRKYCEGIATKLARKLPSYSRIKVAVVPQYGLATQTHEIPSEFVKDAFYAMVAHKMEGIVVKLTTLVYGSSHTVLKPIYYGTQYATFPKELAPSREIFIDTYKCYARVVYMGHKAVPREPWIEPIFGVKDLHAYPAGHPWHGYVPIHIEGFKTAYSMARMAKVNTLVHVPAEKTAAVGFKVEPHANILLHPVGMATPKFYMVAEAAYKRKNMGAWKYPFRLYLPRLLENFEPSVLDQSQDLTLRLHPWVVQLFQEETYTFEESV